MEEEVRFPRFSEVLRETKERKEVWAWDGVIPKGDVTLVAAFMKKGKTTLLTGLVAGMIRRGSYCGRGTMAARRVLYLAPEEGDTLVRRLERLGFGEGNDPQLTVVPRRHRVWGELVSRYRMREWGKVVKGVEEAGYDVVVLDGLHTMLQMFEPQAKEDNEGVGRFMSNFVLPFGSQFTVVASLHTKKTGGDPRVRVPPEEMIRGASAWMAHPGQVLVMDHDRKSDTKTFHAFGRYEGTTAEGFVIQYDQRTHDFRGVGVDEETDLTALEEGVRKAKAEVGVLRAVREGAQTKLEIMNLTKQREGEVKAALGSLVATGMLKEGVGRGRQKTWVLGPNYVEEGSDSSEEVDE